jgi:hypothetical protein
MSYSTSSPPSLETQAIAGPKSFIYHSSDGSTSVSASGYISNGQDLGMKLGDRLTLVETDNSYARSIGAVTAVSTSDDSVTVSFGSLTST